MPPSPPPLVENWPSHIYWRETDSRVKQLWYVSFCLMMSSVQDRLTGLALYESGNLNWSTTAFYYSAVHAGRLMCFVCTGDYPTGHSELASILSPSSSTHAQNPPRQFRFDWLDKFKRYVRANGGVRTAAGTQASRPDREAMSSAIDSRMSTLRARFDSFAPLLSLFKNLRNDCNYEALLVAHEKHHHIVAGANSVDEGVTDGFRSLVDAADRASRLAADLATAFYLKHVQEDPCFEADRSKFHAAHVKYADGRFRSSLREKFNNSPVAIAELDRLYLSLSWPNAQVAASLDEFLDPIMYDTFGEKQGLIRRWRDDINKLQAALPHQ